MKLRNEIEPQVIRAEKLFPQVLNLIHEYDDAFDNADEDKLQEIYRQLSELTGKEITEDDLFEYWEGDGDGVTAFRFCLIEPTVLSTPLSKEELYEIIKRIRDPKYADYEGIDEDSPFPADMLWWELNDYYTTFLELNLNLPKRFSINSLFNRQKVDGKYIEYTAEEIFEKILAVMK